MEEHLIEDAADRKGKFHVERSGSDKDKPDFALEAPLVQIKGSLLRPLVREGNPLTWADAEHLVNWKGNAEHEIEIKREKGKDKAVLRLAHESQEWLMEQGLE